MLPFRAVLRSRFASLRIACAAGIALAANGAACGAVLGLDDLDYHGDAASSGSGPATSLDGSASDASSGPIGDGGSSPVDAGTRFDAPTVITQATTPQALAVDDTRLYWIDQDVTNGGSIRSIAKDGTGAAHTIATGQPSPTDIAVDDDNVYWSVSAPGGAVDSCLVRMAGKAPDAGPPACVTAGALPTARMSISASSVVVLVGTAPNQLVGFAPKAAGATFTSTKAQGPAQALAATGAKLFVGNANGNHVDAFALPGLVVGTNLCVSNCGTSPGVDMMIDTSGEKVLWITSTGQVVTAPIVSTKTVGTVLASLPDPPRRMARDGSYVYVAAPAGSVYAVPLYGAAAAPFFALASSQPSPHGIAVDRDNVYWSNDDGSIRAVGVPPTP